MNTERAWRVAVEVPFDGGYSKNRIAVIRRKKRTGKRFVGKSDGSRARQTSLATLVRAAINREGIVVAKDRLALTIEVRKTDHRADAVNVLDIVCDAVRDATGLDDRWFEVASLRWTIATDRPTLRVVIEQDANPPLRPCVQCLRYSLPADFANGSGPRGRAWQCIACTKALKSAKARRTK